MQSVCLRSNDQLCTMTICVYTPAAFSEVEPGGCRHQQRKSLNVREKQ